MFVFPSQISSFSIFRETFKLYKKKIYIVIKSFSKFNLQNQQKANSIQAYQPIAMKKMLMTRLS